MNIVLMYAKEKWLKSVSLEHLSVLFLVDQCVCFCWVTELFNILSLFHNIKPSCVLWILRITCILSNLFKNLLLSAMFIMDASPLVFIAFYRCFSSIHLSQSHYISSIILLLSCVRIASNLGLVLYFRLLLYSHITFFDLSSNRYVRLLWFSPIS